LDLLLYFHQLYMFKQINKQTNREIN
jgi:hypothetical protein